MDKANKQHFEKIIAKIGLPKLLLKNMVNAFKGQRATYPGHEIYERVEKEINYSDWINKPQTADELRHFEDKR